MAEELKSKVKVFKNSLIIIFSWNGGTVLIYCLVKYLEQFNLMIAFCIREEQ